MARARRQSTAGDFIFMGLLVALVTCVVGALAWSGDGSATGAWFIVAIGGGFAQILLLIGVIAKGVEIGLRTRRAE